MDCYSALQTDHRNLLRDVPLSLLSNIVAKLKKHPKAFDLQFHLLRQKPEVLVFGDMDNGKR